MIEGVPESKNEKEDLQHVLYNQLDQMRIRKEVMYDTAYRVGPYTKHKVRSIVITFIKIADRDEVYAKRANLHHNPETSRIWVNEDLGHNS